jgi:glycine cleavage system H protein
VGISDYMQQRLTDITYVDPPKLGTKVEQFGELGIVESTKANFEVVSPVSGVVLRINDEVYDSPESINEDPYGSWIVEVELTAWEEDQMLLIDGQSYARDVEQKAAEY